MAAARLPKGRYRRVTGNEAAALGLVAAAHRAGRTLVYASYPITPASEILHELSKYKEYDVRTLQTEDEIAACVAAIGASLRRRHRGHRHQRPGTRLEGRRTGPGRDDRIAAGGDQRAARRAEHRAAHQDRTVRPADGHVRPARRVSAGGAGRGHARRLLPMVFEAVRLAVKYMTPVLLLSDSFLANSAEPWRVPDPADLPDLRGRNCPAERRSPPIGGDPQTLARPWAVPGTAGLSTASAAWRKQDVTGAVSYDAANHQRMVTLRAKKIAGIARDIPPAKVVGPAEGDLLVVGWGSTYGPIAAAVDEVAAPGGRVAHLHLRYLNPFPANLGAVLTHYQRVLVAENNMGQLLLAVAGSVPGAGRGAVESRRPPVPHRARSGKASSNCWENKTP